VLHIIIIDGGTINIVTVPSISCVVCTANLPHGGAAKGDLEIKVSLIPKSHGLLIVVNEIIDSPSKIDHLQISEIQKFILPPVLNY
jgi:hypothetical protein